LQHNKVNATHQIGPSADWFKKHLLLDDGPAPGYWGALG
jgi:hypothetical protein